MNKDKKNKKDNKKVKSVLKQILNIFCYVVTGFTFLLSILMIISSCSQKHSESSNSIHNEKTQLVNRNYSVNNNWYNSHYKSFEYPYFRFNSSYSDTERLTNVSVNDVGYDFYFVNPSYFYELDTNVAIIDIELTRLCHITLIDSTGSYQLSTSLAGGGSYEYYDDVLVTRNQILFDNPSQYGRSFSTSSSSKFIVCLPAEYTIKLVHTSHYDYFNEGFTYLGRFDSSFPIDESLGKSFYNSISSNPYFHFRELTGKYVLNPFYDFTNFSAPILVDIARFDFDLHTYEDDASYRLANLQFYQSGNYSALTSSSYYDETSEEYGDDLDVYFTIANRYSYGDYYRFMYSNDAYTIESTTPWRYSYLSYIFTFNHRLTPITKDMEDFESKFLEISDLGVYYGDFKFQFNCNGLALNYYNEFYNGNPNHDIINWFYPSTEIYYDGGKPFKSFVSYVNVFPSSQRYFAGYDFYPNNSIGNGTPLFNFAMNDNTNMSAYRYVTGSSIDYNDLLFFCCSNAKELVIYKTYTPSYPAGTDNPTLMTGVFSVFDLMRTSVSGIMPFLDIEVSPFLTLGTFLFLPFTVYIIFAVIRLFKR